MRYPNRFLASLFVLYLVAGCGSSDDEATEETPVTTAATTTTAALTTTTAPTATTTAAATTTTSPTTTAAPDSGPFRLTFDGEGCTYEGPTELKAGPVSFDFVNEMEEAAADEFPNYSRVNLMRHTGDETAQDMVDYLGPDPSTKQQPSWVSNPQPAPWDSQLSVGETVNWEGNLEPGTYTMICATTSPFGVWFGTGLIVED